MIAIDIEGSKWDRKVIGIKAPRDITSLGIADAKHFIEHRPQSLQPTFAGSQNALFDVLRQAVLSARIQDV